MEVFRKEEDLARIMGKKEDFSSGVFNGLKGGNMGVRKAREEEIAEMMMGEDEGLTRVFAVCIEG